MSFLSHALIALAPGWVALPLIASPVQESATAQEPATEPDAEPAAAAQESASQEGGEPTSEFGEPLFVNGERISDLEIKRYLVYGPARNMLESAKLAILVDQEKQIRAAAGEDVTRYEVTEEEFRRARQREIDEFLERYPGLDLETEIGRAYKTVEWYERSLRQTLEFDKMFFPGDPNEWPEITKEAVRSSSPQVDLIEDAAENYQLRLARAEESGGDIPPEDEMFMGLMRDYVIEALMGFVDVSTAVDGLPPELVMVVEGGGYRAELRTEALYEQNKSAFSEHDLQQAKLFLALKKVAEDQLREEGHFLSDEEFSEIVERMTGDLASSLFTFDFLALHGHQFPSTQAYQQHMRLVESMRRKLASEISVEGGQLTPQLTEHLRIANSIMGLARADAEVLLVSAYDFPADRWKEGGWEWALERSLELKGQIDEHQAKLAAHQQAAREAAAKGENFEQEPPLELGRYWAQLLDLNSEFWDPPMPVSGKMPPMQGMKMKGRFGQKTRNDLERDLGESPYTQFLQGASITDAIFFDMEPGNVAGPFKGPKGYYIVYLKQRTPPTNPLNPRDPKHQELLVEDYLRRQLIEFAHRELEQAEVHGLAM